MGCAESWSQTSASCVVRLPRKEAWRSCEGEGERWIRWTCVPGFVVLARLVRWWRFLLEVSSPRPCQIIRGSWIGLGPGVNVVGVVCWGGGGGGGGGCERTVAVR